MESASTVLLADMWDSNGHMGGGWWIVMMIWMVLFWGAVIFGVVWLARGGSSGWSREGRQEPPSGQGHAEQVLAERLARGEIDIDEYERRLAVLQRTGEGGRPTDAVRHVG